MSKKVITVVAYSFSPSNFEGTLESIQKEIETLIKEYGKDARLDYNKYFYYPYEREASPQYEVMINREETDEEYETRIGKEQAMAVEREAREKAEFERLSKKFGA